MAAIQFFRLRGQCRRHSAPRGKNGQMTDYPLGRIDDFPEGKGRAFRAGTGSETVPRASCRAHISTGTRASRRNPSPSRSATGYARSVRADWLES